MSSKKMENTIAFISDWQKRATNQQKTFIIMLVAVMIVAIVVSEVGVVWFQGNNYSRIVNQNMNYVQDSALQKSSDVERELDNTVRLIRKFANQYSTLLNEYEDSTIEDRLHVLWDSSLFDRVGYVSLDGIDTSLEGVYDVSDRDYFQRARNGESGYQILDTARINNRTMIVFYTPIYNKREMVGIMTGFYERERIDDLLSYQFLNYEPVTYLLRGNGDVIGNSNEEFVTENLFEKLSEKNFNGEISYEDVQHVIADKSRTTIAFTMEDAGQTSIGVVAQFAKSDLIILSILPSDITETMIHGADRSGHLLIVYVSASFLLLMGLFVIFLIKQQRRLNTEMTFATESLHNTFDHDQKQSFIIESLSNTYSSIYGVNIQQDDYERIAEREVSALIFPDTGTWTNTYEKYVERFVDALYQKEMLRFGCTDDFEACLGNNDIISMEYQRMDKGWRKAFMLPSERDENGNIISMVFAVQKIEAEKMKELETQKALKEAYEAAQLASRAKTSFLSNISHDIRTPMNAIVGMTTIAAANLDNRDKVNNCLKKITVSSKHLLSLINEVLDMSKIESGNVDLNEEEFCLSDLIDDLISINQPLIKEKNHALLVRVESLTHEKVIGDRTRLQQVFTNLLTNAIKYTPAGGKIEICVTEKQTNKSTIGWYEVTFKDNGIGMSEDFQKNMFEPFSRAKDSRVSNIQGTGLGMPIARNIIRMMNGDITVKSEINKGSTFTVTFALRVQQEDEANYERFAELPILVVDDDPTACESACLMLNELSMKSEYVTSGREAIEKIVAHHEVNDDYHALIIDLKMPEMNGVETAREIRKRVGNDIPIIVISAYEWTDIEEEATAAGVNAFLAKPLFKSKVVGLFAELMGESHKKSPEKELKESDFSGRRILLAEDNELNREIVIEILSSTGMQIETAEDGKVCVEKFVQSPARYYDMILMDIQMPVMNGYEATKLIRESKHADAKRIPIIALTANAFSTDVRTAFDSGMNGHISKPIDMGAMIKVLEEHLGNTAQRKNTPSMRNVV